MIYNIQIVYWKSSSVVLKKEFLSLEKNPYFDEALKTALYVSGESELRSEKLKKLISEIIGAL